jgi:hypothetical protein
MSRPDTERGRWRRLADRVLRGLDRLRGRAPAASGDFVVFTDAAIAADAGCRSAIVHQAAAPRETRDDLAWAIQVEPIAPPDNYTPFTSPAPTTTRRFWVHGTTISRDPDDAVTGREIAAATQADYVGLIPAPMLDQYIEAALEDIGFTADVTFDEATQSFDAQLAAPIHEDTAWPDAARPAIDLTARRTASHPPSAVDPSLDPPDGASDAAVQDAIASTDAPAPDVDTGTSPAGTNEPATADAPSDNGFDRDADGVDLATVDPDTLDTVDSRLPNRGP